MRRAFVFLAMITAAVGASGQVRASAAVSLIARLPGSVSLSERVLPVMIRVREGISTPAVIPVKVKWNLDPREAQSFRVKARFRGETGPESRAEIRVGDGEFRSIGGRGEMVLFVVRIGNANRLGEQTKMVEIRMGGTGDGDYRGWLELEAEPF